MFRIISFGARVFAPKFLYVFRMSKNGEQAYYAVGRGRQVGIYNNWSECKAQIDGISNAKYRKFFSLAEAEEFVQFWKDYSSPCKNNDENPVSNFSKNGDNYQRSKVGGFDVPETKKLFPLGGESTSEKKSPISLQPYVSPIPLPLQSQFRRVKSFRKPERRTMPDVLSSRNYFVSTNAFVQTDVGLAAKVNSNLSSCTAVESAENVEALSYKTNNSQSVNVSSEVVIKKEAVQEDEDMSEVCSKLPQSLKIFERALKGIARESNDESDKIKTILQEFLEKIGQTNCHINPQMESGENDKNCENPKNIEPPGISKEEPMASQQQTSFLSPSSSTIITTSPAHKSLDQKEAEVLALNLRLDSFEKRFDSCLKEVGAIVSEISHIKSEIKEIKEILSLSPSGCPLVKGSGKTLQTKLNFDSPNILESTRLDLSSRAYSTDQGAASKEIDSGEYKSNRGRRRRLSRSDSYGSSKRFAQDQNDDILSRIKTEEVEYTSFCLDESDFVEVYTDGACHYNGEREAKAGIGIWFGDSHPLNVSEPVIGAATNNVAEIQAARIAIELAVKAGVKKLKVLTDSEFLINCVTKWMHRWKRNGWTLVRGGAVKNRKELEKLDRAASKISVRWEKVLAHSGIKGNEMADRLANQGAEKYTR